MPRVRERRDLAPHRDLENARAEPGEAFEIAAKARLALASDRQRDGVPALELSARDIDEVPARAADRALHGVQDAHGISKRRFP
jgi:hypothetical protein